MNLLDDAFNGAQTPEEKIKSENEQDRCEAERIASMISASVLKTLANAREALSGDNEVGFERLISDADDLGASTSSALKDAIVALAPQKFARKDPEETKEVQEFRIGELIPGKGIFIGVWEPVYPNGYRMKKKFNVFAAQEDLQSGHGCAALPTYYEAAQEVAKLQNWHGHDGGYYEHETMILRALDGDYYKGQWFIPPRALMIGDQNENSTSEPDANSVLFNNLFANQFTGALEGTFYGDDEPDYGFWIVKGENDSYADAVDFNDGSIYECDLLHAANAVRPCRVELIQQRMEPQ